MAWCNGSDGPIPVEGSPYFHIHAPTFGYGVEPDGSDAVDAFFEAHPTLAPYRVEPTMLRRVYAGDDPENRTMTAAMRFADEEEAKTIMCSWWDIAEPD